MTATRRYPVGRNLTACATAASTVAAVHCAVNGRLLRRPPAAAPAGPVVVDSQCIDGHQVQGIDDGNPAGLLARDTGVSC